MRGLNTNAAAATALALCSFLTSTMAAETNFVRGSGGGAKLVYVGDVSANHKKASKSKKSASHYESMYPTASAVPTASAFPTLAPTITPSPTTGKGKGKSKKSGKGKGKKCPKSKSGKAGKNESSKSTKAGKGGGKGSKKKDDLCEEDEVPSAAPSASDTTEPTSTSAPTTTAAPTSIGFEITLDLVSVPEDCREAFRDAANRWEEVIVGDLVDVDTTGMVSGNCPSLPPIIDDVFICAQIAPNDGVGGVLGSAGPEFVRQDTTPFTTSVGAMTFDSDDIELLKEDGSFASVILHEMGHVLGFGTLWDINGFTNSGTPPCSYVDSSKAYEEWKALSGCSSSIPVEQGGGSGTQCSHWDDNCFVDELMTGFSSGAMPISRVTVASMEDMGYEVDYSAADPFTAADLGPSCKCNNLEAGKTLRLEGSSMISSQSQAGTQDKNATVMERPTIAGTKQLGSGRRRKLSDVGRTHAFEYGEMLLLERKMKRKNIVQENDSVLYVGDRIVVVLYEEEGELYGVEVRG